MNHALATPGLVWLICAIGVAGIVRGFSGFGTALIFVPVANIFLEPKTVVAVIALTGIACNAVVLPRAWRQGSRGEVGRLVVAALLTVPVGLWLLDVLDKTTVRWVVTLVAGGMLGALVAGWRFSGVVSKPMLFVIGAVAGLIGGMTGLTGPVVILFYLAGQAVAQSVRANTILFLAALDVVILTTLFVKGDVTLYIVLMAAILSLPYAATTMLGQALFDPKHERLYRWAAYAVIALAVVSGLPVWNNGA
ncbi:MAG: sulfite exporter TauE/SafE family protein [Phycisphaerales bacterium]